MACYYPLDAVRMLNGEVRVLGALGDGSSFHWQDGSFIKHFQVPCGKCIGCRLEKSKQWAIRCMNELETTEGQSWFLTLTYDNEHLPRVCVEEENSGVVVGMPTLKPKDLQDFIKALRESKRRKGEEDIRFFACGEYGDQYKRPHYHAIIFNLNLDDLKFVFSKNGHEYYTSEYIDSIWKKGIVDISDVNFECCAYVARYIMKKATGPNGWSYASDNGLVDEFTRMSRRPGIGYEWYAKHKDDLFKKDYQIISKQSGSLLLQPAKYYDKLFDVENHLDFLKIKRKREIKNKRKNDLLMSQTSVSSIEYRGILERAKKEQITLLHRDFDENGVLF